MGVEARYSISVTLLYFLNDVKCVNDSHNANLYKIRKNKLNKKTE